MEKQKQFITDAGHELKTPLAVISADVDVIELTAGKSEWTDSIRKQTVQMAELIKHLLFLSKMEEKYELVMEEINLKEKSLADVLKLINPDDIIDINISNTPLEEIISEIYRKEQSK